MKRKQLRDWALKSYRNAVDPESHDYLLWRGHGQALVDAAYIAESFLRGYDALWVPLDDTTKSRYIEEFSQLRRVDPPYTNWLLFSSTIEGLLAKAGAQYDEYRVNSAIRKVEEWYTGDGWYADGPEFAFDYYSSYVFHPMYLETLQALKRIQRLIHASTTATTITALSAVLRNTASCLNVSFHPKVRSLYSDAQSLTAWPQCSLSPSWLGTKSFPPDSPTDKYARLLPL